MNAAFVWNPSLWTDRCHYIMEVFVDELRSRGVTILAVSDLSECNPEEFDAIILESTSIPIEKYCFPAAYAHAYLSFISGARGKLALFIHDIHDITWSGGIVGFSEFIKSHEIRCLVTKCEQNEEYRRLEALLDGFEFSQMLDPHSLPAHYGAPLRDPGDRIFDIFMFGNFQPWQGYEFRNRLKELIIQQPDISVFRDEVGGSFLRSSNSQALTGTKLIRMMSHSYLTLCTRTKYDYLVLKYIEGAAAGTVILGNVPSDGSQLFGAGDIVHVNEEMDDEEIIAKIKAALSHKKELHARGQSLRRKFEEKLTMGPRIDRMLDFVWRTLYPASDRKILFITQQDFANVSTALSRAITEHSAGWEARVCSSIPHPFKYETEHYIDLQYASSEARAEMAAWIDGGIDVLVWAEESLGPHCPFSFHSSDKKFVEEMLLGYAEGHFKNATRAIFHAGTAYRDHFFRYNEQDAAFFGIQIASPDLWRLTDGLGAFPLFGKPMYVDVDNVIEDWDTKREGDIYLCHCPSNHTKGTDIIAEAAKILSEKLPHVHYEQIGGPFGSDKHLSTGDLRSRRRKFHIYIDQFSEIGGIGISAFEAMADGIVTLCSTQMIPEEAWRKGGMGPSEDCPLVQLPSRTGDDVVDTLALIEILTRICEYPMHTLEKIAIDSARWVRRRLGPEMSARRFLKALGVDHQARIVA